METPGFTLDVVHSMYLDKCVMASYRAIIFGFIIHFGFGSSFRFHTEYSHHPQNPLFSTSHPSSPPESLSTTDELCNIYFFQIISFSNMHISLLYVFHGLIVFFLVLNIISLSGCITVLFINSPTREYLDCFQILAIMNKDAVIFMCRFLHKNKLSALLGRSQWV